MSIDDDEWVIGNDGCGDYDGAGDGGGIGARLAGGTDRKGQGRVSPGFK